MATTTTTLRKSILVALGTGGLDKESLYELVGGKDLRYKTFMHMVYLLKRDSKVVKKNKKFYLAPEGHKYKAVHNVMNKRKNNFVDATDFANGGEYYIF